MLMYCPCPLPTPIVVQYIEGIVSLKGTHSKGVSYVNYLKMLYRYLIIKTFYTLPKALQSLLIGNGSGSLDIERGLESSIVKTWMQNTK